MQQIIILCNEIATREQTESLSNYTGLLELNRTIAYQHQ